MSFAAVIVSLAAALAIEWVDSPLSGPPGPKGGLHVAATDAVPAVEVPGYAAEREMSPGTLADRPLRLPSQQCWVLSSEFGYPAPGFELNVEVEPNPSRVVSSDHEGRVTLPVGRCRIRSATSEHLVLEPELTVRPGQASIVWVASRSPRFVRVVDEAGAPVASVWVSRASPALACRLTDADGRALLDPGQIEVSVVKSGYSPTERQVPLPFEGAAFEIRMQRSRGDPAWLRCVDVSGDPLAGVVVRAGVRDTAGGGRVVSLGSTGSRGELAVPAEGASSSTLHFSGGAFPCVLARDLGAVPDATRGIEVALPRAATARLLIESVPAVTEVMWRIEGSSESREGRLRLADEALVRVSAANGVFEVPMPLGWPVDAWCVDGHGRAWKGRVELAASTEPIQIDLRTSERMRRVTLTTSTESIERVAVTTTGGGEWKRSRLPAVLTRAGRSVEFDAPTCSCSFLVTGASGRTCQLECGEGEDPLSLVVQGFADSASARFVVVDRGGAPIHDVTLQCKRRFDLQAVLTMNESPFFERWPSVVEARVGMDGIAVCDLPPGTYELSLQHLPWRRRDGDAMQPISPGPGHLVTITGQASDPIRVVANRVRRLAVSLSGGSAGILPESWALQRIGAPARRECRGPSTELWTTEEAQSWRVLSEGDRVIGQFDLAEGNDAVAVAISVDQ